MFQELLTNFICVFQLGFRISFTRTEAQEIIIIRFAIFYKDKSYSFQFESAWGFWAPSREPQYLTICLYSWFSPWFFLRVKASTWIKVNFLSIVLPNTYLQKRINWKTEHRDKSRLSFSNPDVTKVALSLISKFRQHLFPTNSSC